MRKIIEFVQKLDKRIFTVFKWTGIILASPVLILCAFFKKSPLTFIEWGEDVEDLHTFRHFSMAAVLVAFFYGVFHFTPLLSFWLSFGLMYVYEILDGLKLIDKRGFQISDIGANFWGAWIIWLFLHFRG